MPKLVERHAFLLVPAAIFLIGYFFYPDSIMEVLLVCCMAILFGITDDLTNTIDEFDYKLEAHERQLNNTIKELKQIESDEVKKSYKE